MRIKILLTMLALLTAGVARAQVIIGNYGVTSIPAPTPSTLGGIKSYDCAATFGAGYGLQKVNTDGSLTCAQFSGGSGPSLTSVVGQMSSDVVGTTGGVFIDGPSVALTAGTWHLSASLFILWGGNAGYATCKLWNGTTVLASSEAQTNTAWSVQMPLTGTVTLTGADTYKVSCAPNSTGITIKAAAVHSGAGNNASTLVAIAVAGGGGSNPVSAGTAGQIALYAANGATVSGGTVPQTALPPSFNSPVATSANASLQGVFDPAWSYFPTASTNVDKWIPPTTLTTYGSTEDGDNDCWFLGRPDGNCTDTTTNPGSSYIVVPYNTTSIGFPSAGLLTAIHFYPSRVVNAGAKIQAWVIRPGSIPTTAGTQPITFTVVAQVGEISDTNANTWWELSGLSVAVKAGDLLALRFINRGGPFGNGSAFYTNQRQALLNSSAISSLSDMSINGLTVGQVVTAASSAVATVEYFYRADIVPGPAYVAANLPSSVVRLDSSGNVPDRLGRSYDMPWQGKKIIWVGTSIPACADTCGTAGPSYPSIVGNALQANIDNQSVGSSGMVWDGTNSRCLTLMATTAQLTSVCGAGYAAQSYETKVLGKNADMLVIDHGNNDSTLPLGTITDNVVSTFYGAENVLIAAALADHPAIRIVLVTPPIGGATNQGTNNSAVRTAIVALGAKWQIPVVDLPLLDGWTAAGTYCTTCTTYTADGIHPNYFGRQLLARILYQALRGM